MKILLDENLPAGLKADFGEDFEVMTVRDMKWLGKKNGELLTLMVSNEFDYFVTLDRNLIYQQTLDRFEIIIFVLIAINNRRETLQSLVNKIQAKIKDGNLEKVNEVS